MSEPKTIRDTSMTVIGETRYVSRIIVKNRYAPLNHFSKSHDVRASLNTGAFMYRICLVFLLSTILWAQDSSQYIDLPGRPLPQRPILAEIEGNDAIFDIGSKQIVLENFKFKKPWFGSWQVSFKVKNLTYHQLEAVSLQFVFFNKADEVVSDPRKVPAYRIALLPESESTPLPVLVNIPSELRPDKSQDADHVKAYLVSFKARMNREDFVSAAKEKERKAREEQLAALKADQERLEAEAKAQHEKEEQEKAEAAAAANIKIAAHKASEAARKKQKEAEALNAGKVIERLPAAKPVTPAPAPTDSDISSQAIIGLGSLFLFSIVGGGFAIAYANSKPYKAIKKADQAVTTIAGLEAAISLVKRRASEKISLAARNYVVEIQTRRLTAIPLDELKNLAPGVRLQALKSRGLQNLAHLQGMSAQSLMSIKGIGPDSANRILTAVSIISKASNREPIPLPLPGNSNGSERPLLESICLQGKIEFRLADPSGLLPSLVRNTREKAEQVRTMTTFWKWLTHLGNHSDFETVEQISNALSAMLEGGPGTSPVFRNLKTALAESESDMRKGLQWAEVEQDVCSRTEAYRTVLASQLNPDGHSSLPDAVPSRQSSQVGTPSPRTSDRSISVNIQLRTALQQNAPTFDSTLSRKWVPIGKEVTIGEYRIPGGMIYVGDNSASNGGDRRESSLIDPKLPVLSSSADCRIRRMGYWPAYDSIGPDARASYLQWLATGKSNPEADIGYVFLYFYGLERRVLIDASRDQSAKVDIPAIEAELIRLLSIYRNSGSFIGYANSLLDYIRASRGLDGVMNATPIALTRGLTLGLKVILGRLAMAGEPLPFERAYEWYLSDPGTRRRNSLERCPDLYRQAFKCEFNRQFPGGLKLPHNKTNLKVSHRAASGSLNGGVYSLDLDMPDVSVLGSSIQKLQSIGETVASSLEPLSRFLGRNPGKENSLDAVMFMPQELWPEGVLEPLLALRKQVEAAPEPLVMPFIDLQLQLPEGLELNKGRYEALCRGLASIGLGIEPDIQFGGGIPDLKDSIVLFRLRSTGEIKSPSPAFNGASMLIQLASAVARADGDFGEAETKFLLDHINHGLALSEDEVRRLESRLALFRRVPPLMTGLKRKAESLDLRSREAIGEFLVDVVHADGMVDPAEVRTMEKIYKLLGLDLSRLYSQLHGASSAPITVRPAQEMESTFRIPSPPVRTSPESIIKLDMAKVAALKEDSARVAALLGNIFSEAPPVESGQTLAGAPEPQGSEAEEVLLRLDPEHLNLMQALILRPQWTRAELEEMCADRGLMVDGAIERINEAAFERYDQPLIEGDDPLDINIDLTLEEAV